MTTTTSTWGIHSNVGNFLDGSDWSLNQQPGPGQFDIINNGEPTLTSATIDGYTVDIVSSILSGQAVLGLTNATLGGQMLVEDVNSTGGNALIMISGTVTNAGTILLNSSNGNSFNSAQIEYTNETDAFINTGTIIVTSTDGLYVGSGNGGTLINNGVIEVGSPTFQIANSGSVGGNGTIELDNTTLELTGSLSLDDIGTTQTIAFTDATSAVLIDPDRLGAGIAGYEGAFAGFQAGDLLQVGSLQYSSLAYNTGTRVLSVATNIGTLTFAMAGSIVYSQQSFTEAANSSGFQIGTTAPPCFAAGTRIATDRGEVAVEDLALGDRVRTNDGGLLPVRWIGHRHVACAQHTRPWDVQPVRITAGAFAPGVPRRDLLLSPDHAVFTAGVLIPVRYLLNDATIAQIEVPEVTYFHVELATHSVLLAENLPAESFLDTGNRGAFTNAAGPMHLHPDFALRMWQAQACAPLVRSGPALAQVRQRLLDRAMTLGHAMTDDSALRVDAGGRSLALAHDGAVYRVRLPAGSRGVRLASRSVVPARLTGSDDHRRLGVAVSRIFIDGQQIALTDRRLGRGWHAVEQDGRWRWTDGDAALALDGRHRLDIEIAMTERYWADRPAVARRTRSATVG